MVRSLWRLAGRSAILLTMPKHPKQTAEPSTESNRLTPQEIDALRASAHSMGKKMRSWLAARKKQAESE
jgi:hypothetical protein